MVKFTLENPGAATADNSLFSAFLVRRALSADVLETSEDQIGGPGIPAEPMLSDHLSPTAVADAASRSPNRVFVVHGQNDRARARVVSFLETLGLRGIVLHEQPNMGRHLLTKFIDEAELVTFAIVLMTDDDVGALKGYPSFAPRARQNVILELGYFLAHLGQPRVCALITPGLETPSDFDGIVYIKMDEEDRWKAELKRELVAAEMPVADEPR
jgi:predicted nucleotide-binding protein